MKMTWKKNGNDSKNKGSKRPIPFSPNHLPFDHDDDDDDVAEPLKQGEGTTSNNNKMNAHEEDDEKTKTLLAHEFQATGNKLAEEGKYREALGKWESAITLMPGRAVLHEQKAQVLLELEESWSALKSATRATELEPEWAEWLNSGHKVHELLMDPAYAWMTLGRAQLNYGEPDCAINSFDKALAIKPDIVEAKDDRQAALHLVKRRKQLHSTGLSSNENRFLVGDRGY